jgi:hypothetical protein
MARRLELTLRRAALCAVAALLVACSSGPPAQTSPTGHRRGAPIEFAYGTPAGDTFSSQTTRGRVTAVLFVTTFDLSSQLMAKRLDHVARTHQPRINAGAVALEPPNSAPLVEVFRTSLELSFPVGMANSTRVDELGPFGAIDRVPVTIVLDARGAEVTRAIGVVSERELDSVLTSAAH